MSIKFSTIISINIVALIFLAVVIFATNQVINKSFRELETNTIIAKLDRLQAAVALSNVDLETIARDWAHWDDTWNYVSKPHQNYIESNYTPNIYSNYEINLTAIMDPNAKIIYSGYNDLESEDILPIPELLLPYLHKFDAKLLKLGEADSHKGILKTPMGPMMFVFIPVLQSDASGPINGYFMMARFITEDYITGLPGFSGIELNAFDISKPEAIRPNLKPMLQEISKGNRVSFPGNNMISAMDIIRDVDKQDIFWVEVRTSMEATGIGKAMRNIILMLYILIFVIQSFFLHRYLSKKVIDRLLRVQEQVKLIAQNPDKQGSVETQGKDELTDLSRNINLMLQSLHKTKEELLIAKEMAEESDKLKSSFLATMNHELRTPLNHIMGYSQLINTAKTHEEVTEYAAHIYASGDSLLRMIKDIFDLALAEQEVLQVRNQVISCCDVFMQNKAHLEDILISSGKQDDIELVFAPDQRTKNCSISIDVGKVNQVLSNLFRNAVKFTNSGKIEFGFQMSDNKTIKYFVRDSGIGIPNEKQKIIFDFFRQADASTTRAHGGVGIGLAISQKVTDLMKGKLYLESIEGHGSCFYLELPCENIYRNEGDSRCNTSKLGFPDLSDYTILIVEDDETSMTIARSIVERTGAKVMEAYNGQEAVEFATHNVQLDVILMDIKLPVMDGYRASRLIKHLHPELPIIAMSSQVNEKEVKANPEDSFDAFIEKPISRDLVYHKLESLLTKALVE